MQIFFIIFNTFSSKSMIFLLYSPMMLCSMFLLSTLTNTNMALTLDSTHLFSFITNYEQIMFEFKNQWSIADNIYPTDSCLNTIGIQLAWLPFIVKLGVQTMSRSTPENFKVYWDSKTFSSLRSGPGDWLYNW